MTLSIIIVSWKVKDLLRQCLASCYADVAHAQKSQPDFTAEVFVVDNDSRDGTIEMVLKEFPQATLIANNTNLGFGAANNMALEQATGESVLFLNPDTAMCDGALGGMVAYARANPHVGILGPRVLNADGSVQRSIRRFPTLLSQVLIMLKLHHVFGGARVLKDYFAADFDYARAQQVEQVIGAVTFVRRNVINAIGGFDKRFFIWLEDTDYCKRAKDAGFQVWYAPVADVTHKGGESFGKVMGPAKQRYFDASLATYFRIHHGVGAWLLLKALHPLAMLLAYGVSTARLKRKKYDY